ncbi:MAG: hypothetical protein NTX64_14845 [Elusimicrobia bacterium]|nr:hypothetical protein [Elusimicrobiota bacterium]
MSGARGGSGARALLCCGLLFAASAAGAENAGSPFLAVNNSFCLAFDRSSLRYIEPGDLNGGNYFDHEDGYTTGVRASVSLMGHLDVDNVYFRLDYLGSEGKVAYTGYYLGGPPWTPANLTSRATTQEINVRLGKGFPLGKRWMLTPFAAGGRRYWMRELGVGTPGDYVESYSFYYYSLGAMAQFSPFGGLTLTADGALGKTDAAWINVSDPYPMLRHEGLGSRLIQRYSAEADYRVHGRVHVFAGADYEYFTFGQTAVSPTGYFEPFSKTRVFNYNAGVRISFDDWHPF